MSLTTLKRKTAAQYGPHSTRGGVALPGGFSLNGKSRFRGLGDKNVIDTATRTPFKGTDPKGYGGGARCRVRGIRGRATKCNSSGEYPEVILRSNCATPEVTVKASTKTTSGMLESRFKGILHGTYPNTWVKPARADVVWERAHEPFQPECILDVTGAGSVAATGGCGPYSKPLDLPTYQQYQRKLTAQCVLPTCAQRPFPFWASNLNSCNLRITTWQQAKHNGSLCKEFSG